MEVKSPKTDKLKRAMWYLTRDLFFNYIKVNTVMYGNGGLKADIHINICKTFLEVWGFYDTEWDGLHTDTQDITGYLEEQIGFDPMEEEPDYHAYGKQLFDLFYNRAVKYFKKHGKELERMED